MQILFFSAGYAAALFGAVIFSPHAVPLIIMGAVLVLIWPQVAVATQRLHDIGASGWWQLLNLVPVANFVLFLVLLLAPGQDYDNRFGRRAPADAARLPAAAA